MSFVNSWRFTVSLGAPLHVDCPCTDLWACQCTHWPFPDGMLGRNLKPLNKHSLPLHNSAPLDIRTSLPWLLPQPEVRKKEHYKEHHVMRLSICCRPVIGHTPRKLPSMVWAVALSWRNLSLHRTSSSVILLYYSLFCNSIECYFCKLFVNLKEATKGFLPIIIYRCFMELFDEITFFLFNLFCCPLKITA